MLAISLILTYVHNILHLFMLNELVICSSLVHAHAGLSLMVYKEQRIKDYEIFWASSGVIRFHPLKGFDQDLGD